MERMTEKHYLGTDHYMKCSGSCNVDMDCIDCPSFDRLVERLAAYEDTGLTPEDCARAAEIDDILLDEYYPSGRMRELIKADKAGRLVVLPCKVGGEVYSTLDDLGRLHQCRATYVLLNEKPYLNTVALEPVDYEGSQYGASFGAFGKTVFLTREEAEKALEAMVDG